MQGEFAMNFNYLYYPTISIPDSTWLKRTLLYSDKISSIVPAELRGEMGYEIEYLKDQNEYKELSLEEFLFENEDEQSIKLFEKEVYEFYQSEHFNRLYKQELHLGKTLIYDSKFTWKIREFFRSNNLINHQEDDWNQTPSIVGTAYMAILAKHVAKQNLFVPATNSVRLQNIVYKNLSLPRERAAEIKLIESLPSPAKHEPISKIIQFKKDRKEELYLFRRVLRDNISRISEAKNSEEISQIIQILNEDIYIETSKLSRLLKENKINFTLSSINTLVSLPFDVIKSTVKGNINSGAIGAAVDVTSIIKDYRQQKNNILSNSPYSYAFYTNKNFVRRIKRRSILAKIERK